MQIPTNLANILDRYTLHQKYDAVIKQMLSDKQILAWVLKYSVAEMKDYSIEEIQSCIEGTPEVGSRPVAPGNRKENIDGMNTEDNIPSEGKVIYDIRFRVRLLNEGCIGMIINVEAQNKYHPGYDLVTRGVYYCARLLSSQVGDELSSMEYENLQKVYSIWICVNAPQNAEHTITQYKIQRRDLHGHAAGNPRFDLMELIMIGLGRESTAEKGTKVHQLLSTVLSTQLPPREKKEILNREYSIAVSKELEGGMIQMCNLSEGIMEEAMERGWKQGLERGLEQGLERGLEQGLERGLEQGLERGTMIGIFRCVYNKRLVEAEAREELNLSETEFETLYRSWKTEYEKEVK